jgi:hypothetical protein
LPPPRRRTNASERWMGNLKQQWTHSHLASRAFSRSACRVQAQTTAARPRQGIWPEDRGRWPASSRWGAPPQWGRVCVRLVWRGRQCALVLEAREGAGEERREKARPEPGAAGWPVRGGTGLTCDESRLQEAKVALPVLLRNPHALHGHGHVHLQRDRLRDRQASVAVRVPLAAPGPWRLGGSSGQIPSRRN